MFIKRDIERDFRDKQINMYECKYVSIPDDEYNNYAEDLNKSEATRHQKLLEKNGIKEGLRFSKSF